MERLKYLENQSSSQSQIVIEQVHADGSDSSSFVLPTQSGPDSDQKGFSLILLRFLLLIRYFSVSSDIKCHLYLRYLK